MFKSGVGFDIDGTLVNHEEELEKIVNEILGTDYGEGNHLYRHQYRLRKDVNDLVARYYKNDFLLDILEKISPKVIDELNILGRLCPVYILTAREEKIFNPTIDFFTERVPSLKGVIRTDLKKSFWCRGLGLKILVEDRLHIAKEVVTNSETKVILINAHYNVHAPQFNIMPVDSIEDAFYLIYELWKKGVV